MSVAGDTRSPTDKLIAFCSTLNGKAYHFTRYDATSPINDFVTSGSGRNKLVYDYLNGLLATPIPGFGGTFTGRYGPSGSAQILTEIYDYIRSCVNLQDNSAGTDQDPMLTRVKRAYTTIPTPRQGNPAALVGYPINGTGQVAPFLHPTNGTKGLGRFPTLKQMSIMFIARGANQPPLQVVTTGPNAGRPLIFDAAGTTPLLDASYNLTTAGAAAVLSGTATAKPNDMHPYTADPVVKQLTSNGHPVLAVDPDKVTKVPTDASAFYPVFTTYTTTNGTVNAAYPTLFTAGNGTDVAYQVVAGTLGNITYSGGNYTYYAAATTDTTDALRPPQTHAGLNYLTIPRISGNSTVGPMPGAYDVMNPRYQIAADGQKALAPHETQVEAVFFVDPVNNSPGLAPLCMDYRVQIQGLNAFKADGQNLGFTSDATETAQYVQNNCIIGGGTPYDLGAIIHLALRQDSAATGAPKKLNFFSSPITVGDTSLLTQGSTFAFTGTTDPVTNILTTPLTINLLPPAANGNATLQTYTISFPSGTFPTPKLPFLPAMFIGEWLPTLAGNYTVNYPPKYLADLTPSSVLTFSWNSTTAGQPNLLRSKPNFGVLTTAGTLPDLYSPDRTRIYSGGLLGPAMNLVLPERDVAPGTSDFKYKLTADTIRSVECLYGDTRVIAALKVVPPEFFAKHLYYDVVAMRAAHSIFGVANSGTTNSQGGMVSNAVLRGGTCSYLTDVVLDLTKPKTSYIGYNDASGNWGYPTTAPTSPINIQTMLGTSTGQSIPPLTQGFPHVTSSVDFSNASFRSVWANGGDFDNGPNLIPDGPFINKAPETSAREDVNGQTPSPDFNCWGQGNNVGNSLFSANRQISSAVAFGSLPAGFKMTFDPTAPTLASIDPWRTLLFCPNPNSTTHPSLSQVPAAGTVPTGSIAPDYLMLDFFSMPVVEPYAISEPFSTAGKVNMNYQIAPFTYIKRDTAMRGVLRSGMVAAVDDQFIGRYKGGGAWYGFQDNGTLDTERAKRGYWDFRYPIHAGETLKQFDKRFTNGDIFRSPAEICSFFLFPATQPTAANPANPATPLVSYDADGSNTAIKAWWYNGKGTTRKSLTGDNMRERPYDTLYPRLTTKSNSYTVHFRVQVLKKIPGTSATQWVEGKDIVASEFRGSSLIERYIDPSDPNLPDFATTSAATLDSYYKFRVVSTKKFTVE